MKRITPPKPTITRYEDGFDAANDMLERKPTGAALSDLIERIDEPMVIALDGGWGTGKSFFLECWVGEHLKVENRRAQTVYFDAFRHDFMDSPLVSLMGEISERLEGNGKGPTFKKKAIKTLRNAALPLTRLGLAIATYGATEAGGALVDALAKQSGKEFEKAAEGFWKKEHGTRAAMAEFRAALTALTAPDKDGDDDKNSSLLWTNWIVVALTMRFRFWRSSSTFSTCQMCILCWGPICGSWRIVFRRGMGRRLMRGFICRSL